MTEKTYIDRLRGALAERRISQQQAANHLGISQPAFSSRMTKRTPLSVDELLSLSDLLDVAPSSLLAAEDRVSA